MEARALRLITLGPLSCLLLSAALGGGSSTGEIPRLSGDVKPPAIDGRLDEPFWGEALVISDLVQVVPVAGATPSERTEVLLAFTATDLYVGLRCYDREPHLIRATQMERDAQLDPDDRVELLFDTFNDNRTAFWFQLSPGGAKGDALVSRNGLDFNKRWDTIWYARSRVTDEGWFGEMRIPFASLSFDPEKSDWGFNVRRFIRRRTEEVRWASPEPRLFFFGPANAGTINGFSDMEQGLGIDVAPFFVGSYEHPEIGSAHLLGDVGLDAFFRLSSNTKLSLSFNTDFAETEVDARRVNLTRFPLFFPEKRKFFLEDSGVFNFGGGGRRNTDPLPFFSRRIGLDEDGNEVPLLFNAKLTTTTDSYSLGLLDSQTDETGTTAGRNLFVGRFSKNIFEQSSVGMIYTHGDPTGSQDDYTAGVDLNLRTNEFLGDRSLRFSSYVIGTEDSETDGENLAYAASISYPQDEFSLAAGYRVIEDNFKPALGFVRQTGVKRYSVDLSYSPRLYSNIRRLKFAARPRLITLTNGDKDTEMIFLTPLEIEWESGEQLEFKVRPQKVYLMEDFDISYPITIPVGTYDYVRYGVEFETSDKRDVSGKVEFEAGTFYDGSREDYEIGLEWRASSHAFFGLDFSHNDVRLVDGNFRVNLASVKADWHFNPRLSWRNFIQWDDASDSAGLNSRVRFIMEPGRDLFLVLNQGWSTFDDHLAPTSSDLRFKVSYNMRF